MLRRPPTLITLTMEDIAAYEDRKAQAAQNQAARSFTAEQSEGSQSNAAYDARSGPQARAHAFMTPEAQSHGNNAQANLVDESMMVDIDEAEDSMIMHGNAQQQQQQQQGSLFTPPNAPTRAAPAQARQRSRNERMGVNNR